jgi:hypothetical protein
MKEVYIVAAASAEPLAEGPLREHFASEDVRLEFGKDGVFLTVEADEAKVLVRFEAKPEGLGWTPELLTGTAEARARLLAAKGFYRVQYEPGKPQGPVGAFEALWAVRTLLEMTDGVVVDVTAYKIHQPLDVEEITELDFDIRDHVTIHAMETGEGDKPVWVHTHGMVKFGSADVEMFHIDEDDLPAAETFIHELCTDMAFGHAPPTRTPVQTSVGRQFQLLPSEESRTNLRGVAPEIFEGHEGTFLTVVTAEGRHAMGEILEQYRERFEEEPEEETQAMLDKARKLLPAFKARFQRKGLMEPLSFLVRAPFEVHVDEEEEADEEQLWAEVVQWDEGTVVARLVDGGQMTTEWRKGATVELEADQINALAVTREGRALEPEEMEKLLLAELPA